MTDDVKQKSIEKMIEEHTAKMRLIEGNSQYKFNMLNFEMYLSQIESKSKPPPAIMRKTHKEMIPGTVYGPCKAGESDTVYCPNNDDYTAFVEG